MTEFLQAADAALFSFFNQTIANPLFDAVMPYVTDLNKYWWGLTLFGAGWILLFWKGGRKGRVVATLLLVCIVITDQLNSAVLKDWFHRARPCHEIDGVPVMENVRLLVGCGSGFSFPSSHAANNFGAAYLLSHFYRRWSPAFYAFAALVGFSRVSVGVHYPFDILGGAVVGMSCAALLILAWNTLLARRLGPGFAAGTGSTPPVDSPS